MLGMRAVLFDLNVERLQSKIEVSLDDPDGVEVVFSRQPRFEKMDHEFYGHSQMQVDYREFENLKHVYVRVGNEGTKLKQLKVRFRFDVPEEGHKPLASLLKKKKREQQEYFQTHSLTNRDYN